MNERMSDLVTIVTLNCKGLNAEKKRDQLKEITKKDNWILLQETHSSRETLPSWKQFKYQKKIASHGATNSRGSMILGRAKSVLDMEEESDGRIVSGITEIFGQRVRIMSLYAPNTNGSNITLDKYSEFLGKVDQILTNDALPTIIGGDLNIIFNPILDAETPNPSSFFQRLVDEWKDIMEKHKLRDVWRSLHPEEQSYTFTPGGERGRNIYRRLDYILISEDIERWVEGLTMSTTGISDHKILKLRLRKTKKRKPFRLWKHKDSLMQMPEYIDTLTQEIRKVLQETESEKPQARWEYIKYKIRRKARALEKEIMGKEIQEKQNLEEFIRRNLSDPTKNEEKKQAVLRLKELDLEATDRLREAAKVQWVESDEKPTAFFYNRIKQGQADGNIIELEKDGRTIDEDGVNKEVELFYKTLYAKKEVRRPNFLWRTRLAENPLSDAARNRLEADVSSEEMKNYIFKHMQKGKAPGNDGLTVGFYRGFWKEIEKPLLDAMTESIVNGMLPASQRQSIIRLLRKKNKDPKFLKNWRPISLMNVDTKILSGMMAQRMKALIPEMVNQEQLGFVKGKLITDGTRLIRYIIEEIEDRNESGLVAALDFEKAFDSISHEFLWEVLRSKGFPESFVHTIQTLYRDSEAAVINNSLTTQYFPMGRGCKQGDPLSPYLFILAIDPLLTALKQEDSIKPILKLGNHEFKLSAYADDITLMTDGEESLEAAFGMLEEFKEISGLTINKDKTEKLEITQDPELQEDCQVTITGVTFGSRKYKRSLEKANFEAVLAKTQNVLNNWKQRSLTLSGRAIIAKSQGVSQLAYKSRTITIPEWVVKEANKMLYSFIWKGPDKSTRRANMSNDPRSLKITDIGTMNQIHLTECLGELRRKAPWTLFLERDMKLGGYVDVGVCSKYYKPMGEYLPFTCDIIRQAQKIQELTNESKLRFNSAIENNWLFRDTRLKRLSCPRLRKAGYCSIGHVITEQGIPRSNEVPALTYLERMEWQNINKYVTPVVERMGFQSQKGIDPGLEKLSIVVNGKRLVGKHITYQNITKGLRDSRYYPTPPKWEKNLAKSNEDDDWLGNYSYKRWGIGARFRDFCFRATAGVLFSRYDLKKFGIKESADCHLCGEPDQTIEHLFWECERVQEVKTQVAQRWGKPLGALSPGDPDFIPHLTARFLHVVYVENITADSLGVEQVIGSINLALDVERVISDKAGKLDAFIGLWGEVHRREE
jgi:exonuclease III